MQKTLKFMHIPFSYFCFLNEPNVVNREVILEQVAYKGSFVICIRIVDLFTESFVSVFYLIICRLVNY